MITIHISRERYDAILGQRRFSRAYPDRASDTSKKRAEDEHTTYFHILSTERAFCDSCGGEFESVNADTPADLENIKWQMTHSNPLSFTVLRTDEVEKRLSEREDDGSQS